MEESLKELVEFCRALEKGLYVGVSKFQATVPAMVKAEIQAIAMNGPKKLTSTLQHYLDAVSVEFKGANFVVEIDPDDWLANALEEGVKPWNMMDTHLKNAKISKDGYRYKVIPLKIKKGAPVNPNSGDNSKRIQEKLIKALKNPRWNKVGQWGTRTMMDGSIKKMSRLKTEDPDISGLYKIDKFRDVAHMQSGKRSSKTNYMMFRTMTDNPKGGIGKWEHPGIEARHIFPQLQQWFETTGEKWLNELIEKELEKAYE